MVVFLDSFCTMKSLPFSPPYYTEAEAKAVQECILRRWTGTGPKTKEFEEKFATYLGIRNSAGLSSCTAALFLSLKALGVGPGDEVITTAMTFCSTVNIILHCGAKPVLCDVDQISKNIDVTQIEKKITSKTKAIFQFIMQVVLVKWMKSLIMRKIFDLLS